MIDYLYDGSFEGLLTVLYDIFSTREKPSSIQSGDNYQSSLLFNYKIVNTDLEKTNKMASAIRMRISDDAFMNILYVFLSESENTEMVCFSYLCIGFKVRDRINLYLSDDRVLTVDNICRKVLGETHYMLGLTRFRLLKGNIYYGAIEPDSNITMLIAPHFAERMKTQDWIIHDVKRDIAAIHRKAAVSNNWVLIPFSMDSSPILEEWGYDYEALWKQYCCSISIESRKNLKLQRKNMPFRYWKHLIEMVPDLEKKVSAIASDSDSSRYPVQLK